MIREFGFPISYVNIGVFRSYSQKNLSRGGMFGFASLTKKEQHRIDTVWKEVMEPYNRAVAQRNAKFVGIGEKNVRASRGDRMFSKNTYSGSMRSKIPR